MTTANPQITVLMPAYNAGAYIKTAIESVLAQTYADFELLIINDGSEDNTLALIKSFTDTRIRLIDQPNKGLIDTLNESIDKAKGKYIARMDADDICLPNRLQVEFDFLESNPDYVLVGSVVDIVDKDGNFLMPLYPVGYGHEDIVANIDIKCPFNHPSVMFRKEAVIQAGYYPKNALTFEDHLLWKKMATIGKVHNLKDVLLQYRFNPESVTIDEKWRGDLFIQLRKKALEQGFVSDEDAQKLKELISSQNLSAYKNASYYAMVGKKYLWNNPDGAKARWHFAQAIKHYPKHIEPYILYLFSFVPAALRVGIYNTFKKH